jgi:hypothetical protein
VAKSPRLAPTTELCPRCTVREATVESSGFCEPCHAANIADRYRERERIESEARIPRIASGTGSASAITALMVGLRPAELASRDTDPLELGRQVLSLLDGMNLKSVQALVRREEAKELVRQLAWGPAGAAP